MTEYIYIYTVYIYIYMSVVTEYMMHCCSNILDDCGEFCPFCLSVVKQTRVTAPALIPLLVKPPPYVISRPLQVHPPKPPIVCLCACVCVCGCGCVSHVHASVWCVLCVRAWCMRVCMCVLFSQARLWFASDRLHFYFGREVFSGIECMCDFCRSPSEA